MSKSFDQNGEIGGISTRDALKSIVRIAKILEEGQPSGAAQAGRPGLSEVQRDELVRQAIFDQGGKVALAQAMALPIRRNLDYSGVARRGLIVDELANGVMPFYERDIDVAAFVISANGAVPESPVRGDRVFVPEFEVACHPLVRIREAKQRRFNVIERTVQKAKQEIAATEDANFFAALDFASDVALGGENTAVSLSARLTRTDMVDIKAEVDQWDNLTSKYFMNIRDFHDLLLWTSQGGTSAAEVDPVTHREILQTGLVARLFTADVIVSKIVPRGSVFGLADPGMVGVMPIRQNVEVLPNDKLDRLSLGWAVYEIIGLGIANARGTAVGRKA
jgi:hypothetical protein